MRLETLVFPSVPVTVIIFSGRATYLRKSGHSFIATSPGKLVPLCRVSLKTGMVSFDTHSAI